jgi:predicted  nucleic acid-binding Zn-ribbon protein
MIYQDSKRFLKRHLISPNTNHGWSSQDNFLFLNFIQGRYSDDEIHLNASEVRQAFRDFFDSIGTLKIDFDVYKGVALEILPYTIEPEKSIHLTKLIELIRQNRRSIEYPYNGREDQISLSGKIRRAINAEIVESDEAVNKKELIRTAIKQALELSPRDVVVQLKRKYIIKLFQKNNYLSSKVKEPSGINTQERRFQGYNEIDLKNHYAELFNDIDLEGFLDSTMATLFADKLNFDLISNNYYEKNALTAIRNAISKELEQYVSQNDNYLLGLAGYIFRHNFEMIHQRMAIEIFEQINNKSKNAEKFLEYYSGGIYIENGKKYAIPEITTPDGKRWHTTSLLAIASMWLRTRSKLDQMSTTYKNSLQTYKEYSNTYEIASNKLNQLNSDISTLKKQFEEEETIIRDKFKNFKSETKSDMDIKKESSIAKDYQRHNQILVTIKQKILVLHRQKEELQAEANGYKAAYDDLKNKVRFLESEVRDFKQNLQLNTDSFHSILSSLVKAIIQRKRLIE